MPFLFHWLVLFVEKLRIWVNGSPLNSFVRALTAKVAFAFNRTHASRFAVFVSVFVVESAAYGVFGNAENRPTLRRIVTWLNPNQKLRTAVIARKLGFDFNEHGLVPRTKKPDAAIRQHLPR